MQEAFWILKVFLCIIALVVCLTLLLPKVP